MASEPDVLLLGSYYCDLIFNGLPELPRLGLDLFGTEFDIVAGGCYRTSTALKRLGLRAAWLVDFGDDLFSRVVLDMAERDGLDTSLFRHHPFPVRRVSVAFSFVHDRGFISYIDPLPAPVAIDAIQAHRPRAVLISHLEYGDGQAALVAAARAVGAFVYMDCQSVAVNLATPGVREAVARVDVFGPNESEALRLTGAPPLKRRWISSVSWRRLWSSSAGGAGPWPVPVAKPGIHPHWRSMSATPPAPATVSMPAFSTATYPGTTWPAVCAAATSAAGWPPFRAAIAHCPRPRRWKTCCGGTPLNGIKKAPPPLRPVGLLDWTIVPPIS